MTTAAPPHDQVAAVRRPGPARRWLLGAAAVAGALVAIAILKWPTVHLPPTWDAAWSVFPAGLTLQETGFDIGDLIQQPHFSEGGPNTHALSPVTWLTALTASVFRDADSFLVATHLVHYFIGAVALVGLYRFARPALSRRLALAALVSIALVPLLRAQLGFMYLEIPLLAATVYALDAYARGFLVRAAALAALATWIKPSGLIVAAALALAVAAADSGGRWRRVAVVTIPSAGIAAIAALVDQGSGSGIGDLGRALRFWKADFGVILELADVLLIISAFIVLAFVSRHPLAAAVRLGPDGRAEPWAVRVWLSGALFASFVAFYGLAPLVGQNVTLLPRYYVQVVPFVIVAVVAMLTRLRSDGIAVLALGVLVLFSLVNARGALYSDTNEPFVIVERSEAYVDLLELQVESMRALEAAAVEGPVVVSLTEWFKATYPQMGYVESELPNLIRLDSFELDEPVDIDDLPDAFTFTIGDPEARVQFQRDLWHQAHSRPEWDVEVELLERGEFQIRIVHVSRRTQ